MTDLSAKSRRLLGHARAQEPSVEREKARVLAKVEAAVVAGAVAGVALKSGQVLATKASLAAKFGGASWAFKVGAVLVVAGTTTALLQRAAPPSSSAPEPAAPMVLLPTPPPPPFPVMDEPEVATPPEAMPLVPPPRPRAPAVHVASRPAEPPPPITPPPPETMEAAELEPVTPPIAASTPPPSACTLARELESLKQAQRELGGAPGQALATLDVFSRECPEGTLLEEREATRALALCALGQTSEGRLALGRLEQRFPQSPSLLRVRRHCQ